MFVFTLVTVVMMPPQFLVGLFGINVRVPWLDSTDELEENSDWVDILLVYYPFIVICTLSLLLSLIMWCFLRPYVREIV